MKIEDHLLRMLMSNKCTNCGLKQEVGIPFSDYGNEYLCPKCDENSQKD